MDEEFKKQLKEQVKKINKDIYDKMGEHRRLATTIERLRNERTVMNKIISGKVGKRRGKNDDEPADV